MVALATHNFFSAAAGIAVAIAIVRGFSRHSAQTLGNFWVDFTRATLYVLLPLSIVGALLLCSQGVIQNFDPYTKVTTLEGATQTIAQGPVASQEAIKMLGTNGGGFFNANSAHPFENPTPLANFLQMLLIFLIPAGLTYTFGKMVKDTRQGWALFAAMTVLFLAGVFVVYPAEQAGNPASDARSAWPGGNMEGKEVRFGIANSALFTVVTTDASCGAVNNMHDSLTPLGGLVPLVNIELGEVVFGGVGVGAVRHADVRHPRGIHRGPDGGPHAGVSRQEDRAEGSQDGDAGRAGAGVLHPRRSRPLAIEAWPTARASHRPTTARTDYPRFSTPTPAASATTAAPSPGSTPTRLYFNTTLGIAMLCGRFLMIIPLLAAAGSLAQKKLMPVSAGTFPTHGPLFVVLLVGVVVIVGALTFFPALSLGPIVEHFLMHQGTLWS